MTKRAVAVKTKPKPEPKPSPQRVAPVYTANIITSVYLKTPTGVTMLMGRDADEVREKIEAKGQTLDHKFFDDDKRTWAYWAVMDADGNISPPKFPDPSEYSLTSLQLYTKAVTYPRILAHAVGLLKQKMPTLWDKMLKPTTIILAIVGIIFIMALMAISMVG